VSTVSRRSPGQTELRRALLERRLIVCVGTGGVGKTTTAAALGIQGALLGRRTLVVTIDPARRLANSLGVDALGNDERPIPMDRLQARAVTPGGTLHAMMLDTRHTFDDLIRRVAPDAATRDRVLKNLIYRQISDTLSASHDYMASEKLYDLHGSGRYDLIVLDTPPMKNAIDFLEAGGRLSRFLDEKIVGWFLKPHGTGRAVGLQLISGTGTLVYRLLGNVFGQDFLDELSEFFLAFRDLIAGFRERAETVSNLLRDRALTRFVVVTTPRESALEEARYFHSALVERGLPGRLFIVNQMARHGEEKPKAEGAWLGAEDRAWMEEVLASSASPAEIAAMVAHVEAHFGRAVAAGQADAVAVERLRAFAGRQAPVVTVPRSHEEVVDVEALLAVGAHLIGE
jgi:anion-transporting  ArsA/GET3 family ATPase